MPCAYPIEVHGPQAGMPANVQASGGFVCAWGCGRDGTATPDFVFAHCYDGHLAAAQVGALGGPPAGCAWTRPAGDTWLIRCVQGAVCGPNPMNPQRACTCVAWAYYAGNSVPFVQAVHFQGILATAPACGTCP
jgi:hypothetical protein